MRDSSANRTHSNWKHLFICPSRSLFDGLAAVLAEVTPSSSTIDLSSYPSRRGLSEVLLGQSPTLCFIDVESDRDSALALLSEIQSLRPSMPVVAVNSSNDPDLILKSLRMGAKEFLFQPFEADQVSAALDRLARFISESVPTRQMGKVYCLMPGKGACGASTLACGLASAMRRARPDEKILLADLDPSTGTISFLLKLKSQYSFVDALTNASSLDDSIWKAIVTAWQGIDVILSPESPVDGLSDSTDSATILNYARQQYKSIIADCRSPYGDWNLTLARSCDELLVVTTNELPTLHATQRSLAHLERNGVDRSKIRLIVNRFNSEAGLGRDAIEMALHMDVFDLLPNDSEAIQKALLEGKAVAPNSPLGKGINAVTARLTGKQASAKKNSIFSGIFSSLFESKA